MKRAVVIGATSGIGEGLAKVLISEGYRVGITGRRGDRLEALRLSSPDNYIVKSFDCTSEDSIDNLNRLVEELGGVDLIVLSSGRGNKNPELEFEIEDRTNRLNVLAFTEIAVWAYNLFEKQAYGHFVSISSIAGLRGNRYAPSYGASKSYQMRYLEALRQKAKYSSKPIYITDVRPGYVDTAMGQGEMAFWVAPVEKVSKQIFRLIQKRRDVGYVTKRWAVVATIFKLIPNFIYKRL